MASAADTPPPAEPPKVQPPRRWPAIAGAVLFGLALAAGGLLWFLSETSTGRGIVVSRLLPLVAPQSGLRIEAERIDGSLFSQARIRGLTLLDLEGPFATAPEVRLDWSAAALVRQHLRVFELAIPEARLLRSPRLNPADPEDPLIPDIRLTLDRLVIDRLVIEEPVAGVRETFSLSASALLASGRARVDLAASGGRGDDLVLKLDAAPDSDRLDLALGLETAADGLVAKLAGIEAPLTARLAGEGGWQRWRGTFTAATGADAVALLALAADDGRFRLAGTVAPTTLLGEGTASDILGSVLAIEASARPAGRGRTALAIGGVSAALQFGATGTLDRQRERLAETRLAATLRDPAALSAALAGPPVSVSARLEGPLRQPVGTVAASADRLLIAGETGEPYGLVGPRVEGAIEWRDGQLQLPLTFLAERTSGLPEAVAELLSAPRLTATLTLADGRLGTEDLAVAAAGLAARGAASVELATGAWRLAATADVPRYSLGEAGELALTLTAVAAPDARGDPVVRGRIGARATRLAEGVRSQLGGLPVFEAGYLLTTADSRLLVSNGTLRAPALRMAGLRLAYALDSGRFALSGTGDSDAWGPLSLTAGGTLEQPSATLALARPGLGIGLADLVLDVQPDPAGFRIAAAGETPQGPLAARALVELAEGQPLALAIEQANLAGIRVAGRLVQSPQGPFLGRLTVAGSGIDGVLDLRPEGAVQRIEAVGTAAQARIPLEVPVFIGSGTVEAAVLLAEGGPAISGRAALRNVERDGLRLSDLVAEGALENGGGEGRLRVAGVYGGRRISAATRVAIVAQGYDVTADGRYGDLPVRLAGPARIRREERDWVLLPTRVMFPEGRIDVSGRTGQRNTLRAIITGVDLSATRLADPSVAVRGRLDGDIALSFRAADRLPTGKARLRLANFSRPSPVADLPTIDLAVDAESTADGLRVGARLSGNRGSSGRFVLNLLPGDGETIGARLLAGAIAGGVRYSGPAETPWSFLDLPDQELAGPIGLAADFAGTLGNPAISGGLQGRNLVYRNLAFGTRLADMMIDGSFDGPRLTLNRLTANANGGTITGEGTIRLAAEGAGDVNLALRLERARLANSPLVRMTASGPLTLRGSLAEATLSGRLDIDDGEIRIGQVAPTAAATVPVRRRGAPTPVATAPAGSALRFDLRVVAPESVKVDGLGLDSFWGADVRVTGDLANPRLTGQAVAARGVYDFGGRSFDLARGRIGFVGDPWESTLDILATSRGEGFEAGVLIAGTARRPELGFTSNPPLPEDEVLARLLFGTSVADLSLPEAVQLGAALASLRGGGGGIDPIGGIRRATGIDRIRITGADAETGLGTAVAIGERIGRNLYVEVATDTTGNALTTLQYTLTRVLSVLVQVTTLGDASVNLRYARDY